MKSSVKSKGAGKASRRDNVFKLLTSTAMIAMALGSVSSIAGPGKVCLDGVTVLATPTDSCTAGTIGTYYANSPKLRKFVDTLPGLTPAGKNRFNSGAPGEYISVAIPEVNDPDANKTFLKDGSEYFIIGVVEHQQRMHSDLAKPTTLRSYVQLYPQGVVVNGVAKSAPVDGLTGQVLPAPFALKYPDGSAITWPGTTEQVYGYDKPNYLGPIILTPSGTPVRTKMVNLLPKGKATVSNGVVTRGGDMFLPVDESLGGAGIAPTASGAPAEKYPQNRVSFHLHGGDSPWISDGTPHQWITPAGETTSFKSGNRMFNVPDMPFPGEGALTLYWPNNQSARLMWYHDHSFGLTRQNAYGGNAAGYVIYDGPELALQGGVKGTSTTDATTGINKALPNGLFEQIVLVIQDKTFVPDDIAVQDSKWDTQRWGQPGDLWFPHVYEPFQLWGVTAPAAGTPNPADPLVTPVLGTGSNPAGRWDYAVNDLGGTYLPPKVKLRVDPEYGAVAFPDGSFGGASTTPEAYMDTPVINGVAYPVLNVEPKAYRVRFLNGANDRYFNLSLWVADPAQPTEILTVAPGALDSAGNANTSLDAAGIPDPASFGPNIIQFANEAGYLPKPVVHKPTLMPYVAPDEIGIDPKNFYLGSAERADTVIDFSAYAGMTLILYNDGAAPVPGGDPRYDYYTGNPDQSASGGAPSTQPGFGPNTRTMMQIVVAQATTGTPDHALPYDAKGDGGPLATELPKAYALAAENHVDVLATPTTQPIADMPKSLDPVAATLTLSDNTTVSLKIKTIHGLNDPNIGRLVAQLGTELPPDPNSLIPTTSRVPTPLAYIDAPTEILNQDEVQYWWIRNYDVDNHPMHFHLFNVQVLAHYDPAANTMRPPTDDELGWKETVKNWPAEDLLVALKPKTPQVPFGLPNSVRTLDPTMHDGATANDVLYGTHTTDGSTTPFAFAQLELDANSPNYGKNKAVSNTTVDYGWEYVWHCHILGHEENDLMRPMVFKPNIAAPAAPANVTVDATGLVKWDDPTPAGGVDANGQPTKGNSANEIGFVVERVALKNGVPVSTTYERLSEPKLIDGRVSTLANATALAGPVPAANTDYLYQVAAVNEAKIALDPTKPAELSPVALTYGTATLKQAPATPTALAAVQAGGLANGTALDVKLSWADNATNETGYTVQRNGQLIATLAADATGYTDTIVSPSLTATYAYTVTATNAKGNATSAVYNFKPAPALVAPAGLTASFAATTATLTWMDQAFAETGYVVKRATGTVAPSTGAITWGAFAQRPTTTTILTANATGLPADTVTANTLYQYQVSAATSVTVGKTTTTTLGTPASVILATATALTAPTQVQASGAATVSTVGIAWQNSSNKLTTGYEVQRCVGTVASCNLPGATWVPATGTLTVGASTSKFVASGLTTKTTYTHRIAAVSNVVPGATPLRSPWTAGIAIATR